jgi:formamidopyrimidine-DNA glycosylase
MIKAFLLRQDVISGIGNIIADEALWRARIHPKRKTASLSEKEIKTLFDSLQKTVDEILKAGGTSMRNWLPPDGKKGGYQKLYKVYDRAGEKCFRCGARIKRIIIAGRGTSFCPYCQKL